MLYAEGIEGGVLRRMVGGARRREDIFAGETLTMIGNDVLEETWSLEEIGMLESTLTR